VTATGDRASIKIVRLRAFPVQRGAERGFDELTMGAKPAPATVRNEGRDRGGQ
jgi:hypothetical protein